MKNLNIAGTVITNRSSALELLTKLNSIINIDSFESALAINTYEEQLVKAGFLTWEETELCY